MWSNFKKLRNKKKVLFDYYWLKLKFNSKMIEINQKINDSIQINN